MAISLGENLIANGNAEQGEGDPIGNGAGTSIPPIPGWTASGSFSVLLYGATGFEFVNMRGQTVRVSGLPDSNSPGPADRGVKLFYGGGDRASASGTQLINISELASGVDASRGRFELSGWMGGYENQLDSASLNVTFLDLNDRPLGNATIETPPPPQRSNLTGLFLQSVNGAIPAGTRQISVALNMNYISGRVNDAYADNLSLIITGVPELIFGTPASDNGISNPAIELRSSPFPYFVFSGGGSDSIDGSIANSTNVDRLYAGDGDDKISAGSNDRLFGGNGNDTLDASLGNNNRLYGGVGDDTFFLGNNDRSIGGEGSDRFFAGTGGGNTVTGDGGADQFWVVANGLPRTSNTVTDLELTDAIGINGYTRSDLAFKEANGNSILTVAGIDVATFVGVSSIALQNANFVFT